jgi:DNA-directed RNA polymerase specialized sigma24 family protein
MRQLTGEESIPGRDDCAGATWEQLCCLEQALAELPEPEQRLIRLRLEGWTFEQIATQEGRNPGAVWRHLREPLRWLRLRMLELGGDVFEIAS